MRLSVSFLWNHPQRALAAQWLLAVQTASCSTPNHKARHFSRAFFKRVWLYCEPVWKWGLSAGCLVVLCTATCSLWAASESPFPYINLISIKWMCAEILCQGVSKKCGLQPFTELQLLWIHKNSSLYMSVSTSLSPLKCSIHISCNLDLAAVFFSERCWCIQATLLFQLPSPNWTPQPTTFWGCLWCWPPANVIAQFATGFAILILILFSGNSIKQVRRLYLTNLKKLLLNVETLFKHAVTLGVRRFLNKRRMSWNQCFHG